MNKFTLREWRKTLKDPKDFIINASHINGNDDYVLWPVGMSINYLKIQKSFPTLEELQFGSHTDIVLLATSENIVGNLRINKNITLKNIIKMLEEKNITNLSLSLEEYFISLPKYNFIICHEGNGVDTNKIYEVLMAGCIPIVEYSKMLEIKYGNMPILFTKTYQEINEKYLNDVYLTMLDKEYDFSNLFLSSFPEDIRNNIIYNSRFWCLRLLGELSYPHLIGSSYKINMREDVDNLTFSVAIPTMNRYEKYLKEYIPKYLKNNFIKEIVICDENGNDYEQILKEYPNEPKIKLYKNDKKLGALRNKIKVMSLCNSKYIALIDSDNFVDEQYFTKALEFGLNEKTVVCPSYSHDGRGNFKHMQFYNPISKYNWNTVIQTRGMFPCLNDGNCIFPKIISTDLEKIDTNIEPYGSDAYVILQFVISMGYDVCFADMTYVHPVSEDSLWIETESQSLSFMRQWYKGVLEFEINY